jgi:hypothetical protein
MTTLRATVIMKTDIRGSTVRFRALPEVDLDGLLTEHRALVSRVAAAHDGRIVKPEGDGFWIVFPSVTSGALAAMTMQEELHLARVGKGDDRLAMRIVLTLGVSDCVKMLRTRQCENVGGAGGVRASPASPRRSRRAWYTEGYFSSGSFIRKLLPSIITVSAWCSSRSKRAEVRVLSLLKILGHSLKARLEVMTIAPCA